MSADPHGRFAMAIDAGLAPPTPLYGTIESVAPAVVRLDTGQVVPTPVVVRTTTDAITLSFGDRVLCVPIQDGHDWAVIGNPALSCSPPLMPEVVFHFDEFWHAPSFPGELAVTDTFEIEAGGAGNLMFAWALFDTAHSPPAISGIPGSTLIADMTGSAFRARLYRATRSGSALTVDVTVPVESYGEVKCFEIPAGTVSSTITTFNASGTAEHDFASSADGALLFGFTDNAYPPDGFMTPVHLSRSWPSSDDSTVLLGSRVTGQSTVGLHASIGLLEWVAKIDVGFAP